MLQSVYGKVLRVEEDGVEVQIRDVALFLFAPLHFLRELRVGERKKFYTDFLLDDTGVHLFGFSEERERDLFRRLRQINGIGKKGALKLLQEGRGLLLRCIAEGDEDFLLELPGVGKKAVRKLVIEIREEAVSGKWGKWAEEEISFPQVFKEAHRALKILGLKEKESEKLLRIAQRNLSPPYTLESLVREALKSR